MASYCCSSAATFSLPSVYAPSTSAWASTTATTKSSRSASGSSSPSSLSNSSSPSSSLPAPTIATPTSPRSLNGLSHSCTHSGSSASSSICYRVCGQDTTSRRERGTGRLQWKRAGTRERAGMRLSSHRHGRLSSTDDSVRRVRAKAAMSRI